MPLQQLEDDQCQIGSGGNGSVFLFKISGGCFAIKKVRMQFLPSKAIADVLWQTEYRAQELSLWSQFDHPNVVPLLAVAIVDYYSNCPHKSTCWQVMPQMQGV